MQFTSKKPHYEHLKKKWTAKHKTISDNLWNKHIDQINQLAKTIPVRQLAVGGLGSLMLLTTPGLPTIPDHQSFAFGDDISKEKDNNKQLAEKLKERLPNEVRSLGDQEEKEVADLLTSGFGFPVSASLEGIRLNRSYGLIGGEQHLYRYPGDSLQNHAENAQEWAMYGSSGIAPGLGAWGYFASSKAEFSEKDKLREKYYLAVQTFLAPGFAENVGKFRDFFKFRKMLVINPDTGQAVVAVIGDAGPSPWTGKQLGGSPEVMHYLGLAQGSRKGAVLYFFIDDPEDSVPLGPVKVKEVN